MKNWTRIFPLIFVLLVGFQVDSAFGQYYGKKKKKKKPKSEKVERTRTSPDKSTLRKNETPFIDKLWFGGGFNLGFDGNQNLSLFNLGLTPMVGYKFTEKLSAGPRIGFSYNYIKGFGTDFNVKKVQTFSPEIGAFARYKFLPFLFAHADYNRVTQQFPQFTSSLLIATDVDGNPLTSKFSSNEVNVGLGYTSDALIGYEILLLYDFLANDNANNILGLPFKLRFGFNYRF